MRSSSFEEQMLTFMGENKRLLNIHKYKFVNLVAFQVNTTVFQANTNASLKKSGDTSRPASPNNAKSV